MTRTYQEQLNWGDPHIDGMHFAGHWRDFLGALNVDNTEYLDDMHARHYDPNLGRFLSVDPVVDFKRNMSNPQGWNRYAYVMNNPLRWTDPTGKYVCQGSTESCKVANAAIANIATAAAKLADGAKRDSLNKIVSFFGKPGEKNGVFVRVNMDSGLSKGAGGGTSTTIATIIGVRTSDLTSRNDFNFQTEMTARMTHEGQHGIDQRIAGMPTNRAEEKLGEIRAFTSQSFINEAFAQSSPYGVWTAMGGFDRQAVEGYAEKATQNWCADGGPCH